jgi:hypothetical protein
VEAYPTRPTVNKPVEPFALLPYQPRRRKKLTDSVTGALATILPWTWSLGARLGRTWGGNRKTTTHAHSIERGGREAQLADDLARLHATGHYRACARLPYRYRCSYEAVISEVHRLLGAGPWCQPRSYVDRTTGETKTTLYLPEDTWRAQGALAWCVAFLDRLAAALPRMTEPLTPRYRPGATATRSEGHDRPKGEGAWLPNLIPPWLRPPRAQPELPATS